MVVGAFQEVQRENKVLERYDYIGVLYPEGFINFDSMLLFNHEQINDVIFTGYDNPEREDFMAYMTKNLRG